MFCNFKKVIKNIIREKVVGDIFHSKEYFQHRLNIEKQRAERHNETLSVVVFDLKELNNKFIREIEDTVFTLVRCVDVAAWYSTEKIAILLCDTPFSGAQKFIKRLNEKLTANIAEKKSTNINLVDKITTRIFTYPENYNDSELKLNNEIKLQDANLLEPINLNGQLSGNYLRYRQNIKKRFFDIILSYSGLVLLTPLFGIIALLIKITSPGPVFFRQKRTGYGGKSFELLKFRSMYHNVDQRVHEQHIKRLVSEIDWNNGKEALSFKIQNDDRITALGKFLRKTCLDELPQLINVLKGDMSLVGPRPHPFYEVSLYSNWYQRRLGVKPGVTGLWQINGKKRMRYRDAIRLDLLYIDKWSVGLDFKILAQTIPNTLIGAGSS